MQTDLEKCSNNEQSSLTQQCTQISSLNINDYQPYEYIVRSPEQSIKYTFTLMGKEIHVLDPNQPKESIKNIPIVCSYADMQFRLDKKIQKQWLRLLNGEDLNLGYTWTSKQAKKLIIERTVENAKANLSQSQLLVITSMLSLYYLVVTELTQKQDQILLFTPTYYRFLFTINDQKRKVVEYELKTRGVQGLAKEFYICFEELEETFKSNDIKLMVWANPYNPTGRIWKKQQIIKLKDLCIKYGCLIFSDDIFVECVQNPKKDYTSFLQFQDLYPYLIWASSFGKGFNCSGNSFTYSFIPNPKIKITLQTAIMKSVLFPTVAAVKSLQSCFTVGQEWRVNTVKYIKQNYEILKRQLLTRKLAIEMYSLQSGFVAVMDFQQYKWNHTQIKRRLQLENIFPTYFDGCYVQRDTQSISGVRVNLAMNRTVLMEMVDRLEKVVKG